MRNSVMKARAGFTLVEVMIALTITALIGAALTGVLVNQMRFYDQQEKLSNARQVSRSALNVLLAELRMVETSGGIEAASPTSITALVPYAMGLVCGPSGGNLRVSLQPYDEDGFNAKQASGFAYRNAANEYTYHGLNNVIPEKPTTGACLTLASVITLQLQGGTERVIVTAATPPAAAPMFFYQRVTYSFGASETVPGQIGLFRTMPNGNSTLTEELVAPFGDDARFRFYVSGSQTPQDAAPGDLSTLRGVEVVLTGLSERRPKVGVRRDHALLTTAIFFKNTL